MPDENSSFWAVRNAAMPQLEALPEKLSDLLEVALTDLTKVRETRKIDGIEGDIYMDYWLNIKPGLGGLPTSCTACLAGCVIGNRLNLSQITEVTVLHPSDFGGRIASKMSALNYVREGEIVSALRCLGYNHKEDLDDDDDPTKIIPEELCNQEVQDFDGDSSEEQYREWLSDMREIIHDLRRYNL